MYVPDNIEIIQKRCLKTIFPGFTYEDILQMVNIPTVYDKRNAICKAYYYPPPAIVFIEL